MSFLMLFLYDALKDEIYQRFIRAISYNITAVTLVVEVRSNTIFQLNLNPYTTLSPLQCNCNKFNLFLSKWF